MHIFEALMKDHETLKDLLAELVSLNDNDIESRNDLVEEIRDELVPHSRAEESVLYNSLRALDTEKQQVMHSYREHMEAEALLRALQVEDKLDMSWRATAQKLKSAIEHHIHEEETRVFDAARKVFSQEEAKSLGELFMKLKPQIQDESFAKTSLEMVVNLMPPRLTSAIKNLKSA